MKSFQASSGFTLVELMVTVGIVAILAAFAIPSYQQYIQRTYRTEAMTTLLRINVAQEKFFNQRSRFANSAAELSNATNDAGTPGLGIPASTAHYDFVLNSTGPTNYTATATATHGQLNDTDCQTFTIDNTGLKGASDDGGTATTTECWK